MLAAELGCGSVPIRKKGKLPGQCLQHEYQLEYGSVRAQIEFIQKSLTIFFIVLGCI